MGNNDSTGWIWSEGRAGRLAAGIDLSQWGASFAGLNISELFADIHGGTGRTTVGDDLFYLEGNFELGPVAGWSHALVHASALLVQGRGVSEAALDSNLLTVSNIETNADTQLHELWLEQLLLHRTVSLRVGQLAADAEFAISPVSATFLNGSHGWPAILGANLPGGGPAYPLASPAARVAWLPSAQFAFAAGVYSNAARPHSTMFSFGTGALVMAESRYSFVSSLLPGSLSLGYWHDSGRQDSRVPAAQARLSESGQSGYYFMVDRAWGHPSHMTLSAYARGFIADSPDRAVSRFFDAGIELARVHSDQRQDMLGLAVALAVPGTELDPASPRDQRRQIDLELSYSLRLYDAWTLQPDMQYLVHPGTRIDAIGRPSHIANALVAGLRVSYEF